MKGNFHKQRGICRHRSSGAEELRDNSKRKFLIQVNFSYIGNIMSRRS
jgi:hypothetical protein